MIMSLQRTISPVDGRVLVERQLAGERDDRRRPGARAGCRGRLARHARRERAWRVLGRAIDHLVARRDELAAEITWQMGRPIAQSPGEIRGLEERARYMLAAAPQRAGRSIGPRRKPGFTRFIRREPLGLVFVIAPWNYPYLTAVNSIVPALAAGNVVLLKHSAQTPLCAERFQEAFDAAGLPPGVFQHLHMGHDAALRIVASGAAQLVAFTGSVPAGHAVQAAAGQAFIATNLELGGKDPAYVREDADLAHAVENLVDGACFNSGQSCCGIERIYVHERRFDAFVAGLCRARRASTSWATRPTPRPISAPWSGRRPPTSPAARSTRPWRRVPAP